MLHSPMVGPRLAQCQIANDKCYSQTITRHYPIRAQRRTNMPGDQTTNLDHPLKPRSQWYNLPLQS